MKKVIVGFVMLVSVGLLSAGVAFGTQNPVYQFINSLGYGAPAKVDNQGNLMVSQGISVINAASGVPFVVKATPGRLTQVNVISASGVGAVYDAATTGAAGATNEIGSIPATAGIYVFDWPAASGIVINPSSSVISVKYQ